MLDYVGSWSRLISINIYSVRIVTKRKEMIFMKKILSMFLALTLAASCVVIANAEGMKTSQGLVAPRGASVTITEKNGIKTNVFDYDYANQENPNLARPNMYQSEAVESMENLYSLGLDSDGLIVAKKGYEEDMDDAHELFNPNTTHSDVIYKGIDVGSMYTYDPATNEYIIDSYKQSATFNKETGLFTITDEPSTNVFLASSFGEKSFGITTETNFIMPESGKLDLKNDTYEDMMFEFTGDDLVLVYIDGVRVLNGSTQWCDEQNYKGNLTSINFATGVVKTRITKNTNGETTLYKKFSDYCDEMEYDSQKKAAFLADKFEQNAAGQYIFKKGTVHSFKMFYAETGSGLVKNERNSNKSNNYTRFNLISTKEAVKEFTDIPVADDTSYTLIFMNDQDNGTEVYKVIEDYGFDSIDLVADVADTDFEESLLPFAGWFTNKSAALSGGDSATTAKHVDTTYAYPRHVELDNYVVSESQEGITVHYNGETKTYTENYVVFYAGWVPEIKHKQDADDANGYGYTDGNVDGFKLHGVQIRSKEIADRYQDENRNTDEDALRYVTSYGIDFINELGSLNDKSVKYGYMLYAKEDLDNLSANITSKTPGAYNADCTRTGDRNHHYYEENGYLLSTVVVKYDSEESKALMDRDIEARAYVNYTDANGNERYNFDTYKLDYYDTVYRGKFKGGCRTSFNNAYAAVSGLCDSLLTDR